jgi:hypothetical protein
MAQVKTINTYWHWDEFDTALQDAYAEGWTVTFFQVTEGRRFYAILEKS